MKRTVQCIHFPVALSLVLLVFGAWVVPPRALALGGGAHAYMAREAADLFEMDIGVFPALEEYIDVIDQGARHEDQKDHVWDHGGWYVTCTHFWEADNPDLAENYYFVGYGECANAFMKSNELLDQILEARFSNNLYVFWERLGHIAHLIGDMTVPAHAHVDYHISFDSYDDGWIGWDDGGAIPQNYRQFTAWDAKEADGVVVVPESAIQWIISDHQQNGGYGLVGGWETLYSQLYYLMYTTAQYGDYFASDDQPGDLADRHGWLDYFSSPFPLYFHDEDGNIVGAQSTVGLDDNWWYEADLTWVFSNHDGDYTTIGQTTFIYGIRAVAGLYLAFRDAFDPIPPTTTADLTYSDTQNQGWTKGAVTMVVEATDEPEGEPFGVYRSYWRGESGQTVYDGPVVFAEEGIHDLQYWSLDNFGNYEPENNVTIMIDGTPPEIAFPDLKDLYLTSEEFIATWVASDGLSGINSETAWLDGEQINKGEAIDLASLAGSHRLEVYADDVATNIGYAFHDFEVAIDADGWVKPKHINDNTAGKALFIAVEFPAPYDVGRIDYTTCTLFANGFPIPADLVTGIGDRDGDHNPDLMLRFDREQFVAAIAGQAGDLSVGVWGGLVPGGQPRFVADVTVPVFDPPQK